MFAGSAFTHIILPTAAISQSFNYGLCLVLWINIYSKRINVWRWSILSLYHFSCYKSKVVNIITITYFVFSLILSNPRIGLKSCNTFFMKYYRCSREWFSFEVMYYRWINQTMWKCGNTAADRGGRTSVINVLVCIWDWMMRVQMCTFSMIAFIFLNVIIIFVEISR